LLVVVVVMIEAANYKVHVGQELDGFAALYFFPNIITIQKGDSILFAWESMVHTVTFFENVTSFVDPTTLALSPSSYEQGNRTVISTKVLVSSGILKKGNNYTVTFPVSGNFSYHCAIHSGQFGLVNVIDTSPALDPTSLEAATQIQISQFQQLLPGLRNTPNLMRTTPLLVNTATDGKKTWKVFAGGGTTQFTVAYIAFTPANYTVHVGDTVIYEIIDAVDQHTVAFNSSGEFNIDFFVLPDGRKALNLNYFLAHGDPNQYIGDFASSGILAPASFGLPFPSSFSITFNKPGLYPYICDLHLDNGMRGWVTVSVATPLARSIAVLPLLLAFACFFLY